MGDATIDELAADQDRLDIIAFQFIKIGEAVSHLPVVVTDRAPEIDWTRARQMRNYLAHVYWGISPSILWATARDDLPPMVEPLRRLLRELEKTDPPEETPR